MTIASAHILRWDSGRMLRGDSTANNLFSVSYLLKYHYVQIHTHIVIIGAGMLHGTAVADGKGAYCG